MKVRPGRDRRSAAGFTLLEALVVVAVLGLVFVGLVQGNRLVLAGRDRQTRLVENREEFDALARTPRHLIEQARPGSKWENLVFSGTARVVTFSSVMPPVTPGMSAGRADVALAVDESHRLLLVLTPHLHAIRIGTPARPTTTEFLQGVERLDLAYLPAAPGTDWTSVWHEPVPPRLVRIRILFSDAGHPLWPDIIASPMLDAP